MMTSVQFQDFNFKLAVVQVLMFDKELIKPRFNLREFIANYQERKIDIEDEGYDMIPEVKKYFEELSIPSDLLHQVEEIYQDGGNEIHLQLIPFWDGEDERFNITSTDDLRWLPNLKKITLLYDDEEKMASEFIDKGIDAEYL